MCRLFLIVMFIAMLGCTSLRNEIMPEPKDDAIIATRIKAGLIDAAELDAAAIEVKVDQGKVILEGFVETEAQKNQAVEIAAGVADQPIDNQLEVKP